MVDPLARLSAQRSVRRGKHGEAIARHLLDLIGVRQIVHIETGWRIVRMPGGRIINAVPLAKVPGDWRGITGLGRSVMCEAKERKSLLVWSDLEDHQHQALAEHARLGGTSYIVITYTEARFGCVLPYPCSALQRGRSGITPAIARVHALRCLDL